MNYYPLMMDLRQKSCLVIGGGRVAYRKILRLLNSGAVVHVISPEFCKEIQQLSETTENLYLLPGRFKPSDLKSHFLVIGATDDPPLNKKISEEARKLGIPVNIVDKPDLCDFILPAVVNRGNLLLAVSTQGKAPFMAKRIRQLLEKVFDSDWEELLYIADEYRKKVLALCDDEESKKNAFSRFSHSIGEIRLGDGDLDSLKSLLNRFGSDDFR